jgi:uncharacterized protein (DUF58 family)
MRWFASWSPTSRRERGAAAPVSGPTGAADGRSAGGTQGSARLLEPATLALLRGLALPPLLRAPGSGPGIHGGIRRGREDSLLQHRPYVRGDDRRTLDWRASARTGQLLIQERHAPARHPLVLLLDTSPSMDFPAEGVSKAFRARQLAAAAAVLALWRGDGVHLHRWEWGAFGHRVDLRPGRAVVARVEAALRAGEADGAGLLADALAALPSAALANARVVLLSDLYGAPEPLLAALRRVRRLASGLSALHVLDASERRPAPGLWRDVETGETRAVGLPEAQQAAERVERWCAQLRSGVLGSGSQYVAVERERPLPATLQAWLGAGG